jgi:hypothetical protein
MTLAYPACFVIELKTGDHLRDIPEGLDQLGRYWEQHVSGQVRYYTDRGTIYRINAFLFATRYSPSGCLYKREPETRPLEWDYFTDEFGLLEYPMSKIISTVAFNSKARCLTSASNRVTQRGQVLAFIPEFGVLKAGILKDFRVTDNLWMFFARRAVVVET